MPRTLAVILLVAIAFAPAPAAAQQAARKLLYGEGRMLVLVAPQFPKSALAKGESAKVEVFGTVRTDGSLDSVRIEVNPPNEAFESAVMDVVPLWRLQPRIVAPACNAEEAKGHVTIWFDLEGGKEKVSYAARPSAAIAPPDIRNDRSPVRAVDPVYPPKFAQDPKAPKATVQVAYVGVAEDGAVTGVTLAPMLHYRDFEPYIFAALRQWKFEPQSGPWCGEMELALALL